MRITTVIRSNPRTGRLVRSVVVTPKSVEERPAIGGVPAPSAAVPTVPAAPSAPPATPDPSAAIVSINEAVDRIAAEHDVPSSLIQSVIRAESNYDPAAVSPKGAQGLMQLIPATARRFGVSDAFDPFDNIQGGVKYLRYLLDLYGGDYPLVLAAYNAGEGAVTHYGGVPPFPETQNYLLRVARNLKAARPAPSPAPSMAKTGVASTAPPAGQEAGPPGPSHIVEIVEPDGSVRYVSR